jgi:predicted nucleic acid-binding protein
MFGPVLVPPAVFGEVGAETIRIGGGLEVALTRPLDARVATANLGAGETQAISLALELGADLIVLDDDPARRLARSLGLPLIGTLGVLLAAKQRGVILAVEPLAALLAERGFRLNSSLLQAVLDEAGED